MSRETHASIFGSLVALCLAAIVFGLAWWFVEVFAPKIEWHRIAAEFAAVPGGAKLTLLGFFLLPCVIAIGKAIEPR